MQILTETEGFPGFGLAPLAPLCGNGSDQQVAEAVTLIRKVGGSKVGFLGLACAPSGDGSQESPILTVMTQLASQGVSVAAFDPAVYTLTNRMALDHAGSLFSSADEIIDWCETLVVVYHSRALQAAIADRRGRCHVVDLIDLFSEPKKQSQRRNDTPRCVGVTKCH